MIKNCKKRKYIFTQIFYSKEARVTGNIVAGRRYLLSVRGCSYF